MRFSLLGSIIVATCNWGQTPVVLSAEPPAPALNDHTTQIAFDEPEGMEIRLELALPGQSDPDILVVPARYPFPQGAIHRMKLTNIPGHPGIELHSTLEVALSQARSEAFLAHSAVTVGITAEDLGNVLGGTPVARVMYLPDPEFQELALAAVSTIISTHLAPGADAVAEARHRGIIVAILRLTPDNAKGCDQCGPSTAGRSVRFAGRHRRRFRRR